MFVGWLFFCGWLIGWLVDGWFNNTKKRNTKRLSQLLNVSFDECCRLSETVLVCRRRCGQVRNDQRDESGAHACGAHGCAHLVTTAPERA